MTTPSSLAAARAARDRHLRRAFLFVMLAVVFGSVAPMLRQQQVEAAPTAARIVFPGWNVGATPRVCSVDSTIASSVCASVPITDASPDGTSGVAADDLNADGRTDVVIANENGGVNICLDNGTGGWACTAHSPNGRHSGVAIADLDGNGSPDVVSVNETQAHMKVCINNGTGAFTCSNRATPNYTTGVAALDVDGDADNDLVISGDGSGVHRCLNNGAAVFTCSTFAGVTSARDVEAAMLDGDPYPDLVFASYNLDDMVCFGAPSASFTCSSLDAGATYGGSIGDLDGDTDADVVLARSGVASRACLNDGSRGFTCHNLSALVGSWRDTDVADVTGDGLADIVVAMHGPNLVCAGDGMGNVSGCTAIDAASSWHSLHVAVVDPATQPDTDGDGLPDGSDNCPSTPNPTQTDTDGDSAGDACDTDDDDDGLLDVDETGTHGTDPLLADTDGDGFSDFVEVTGGGNPQMWPQTQAVSIAAPDPWHGSNGTFEVLADTTSGLPLVVTASGQCSVSGLTAQPLAPGSCTLTASQGGSYLYLPASNTVTVDLVQTPQTVLLSAPASMTVDDTIAIGAVSDSGLPVALTASGPCTLAGSDLTVTGAGTCTVDAAQPGDAWWAAGAATAGIEVVRETQAITIAAPASMSAIDTAPVTVTTASGLPVSSLTASGACDVVGGDVVGLVAGTCTLTATQDGDAHWDAATATFDIDVVHATQTVTLSAPSSLFVADTSPVTATADSALLVTLSASGPCSLSGGVLTATGAGSCTVTAVQAGDAAWSPATATHAVAVAKRAQTIAMSVPSTLTAGASTAVLATSTSGLPVTLAASGPCALSGSSLLASGAGTCTVSGTQPGNTQWLAAPAVTAAISISALPTTTSTTTTSTTTTSTTTTSTTTPTTTSTTTTSTPTSTTVPMDTTTTVAAPTSTTSESTTTVESIVPVSAMPGTVPDSAPDTVPGTVPVTSPESVPETAPESVPDLPAVRVSVTVDDLVDDGLPDASELPLVLVLAGQPAGTRATLNVGTDTYEAAEVDGALVFELPARLDLTEATLLIVLPDGTVTRITSADSFRDGDLSMDVEFEVIEGADAGGGTIRVLGNGFAAGSPVAVTLHSDPVVLGTVSAGPDGRFDQQMELPATVEPGEHRVLLAGQSADGPITGTWNFAVAPDGSVERVGDPPVEAEVAGAGLEAGAIEEAAAAGNDTVETPAAGQAGAAAEAAADDAAGSAASGTADVGETPPVVIDGATGLPEFTPVSEPKRAVATAVESFALLSVVGAGSSLLAAGMASMPAGGLPGGSSAPTGSRPGGGGGGGSGGGSGDGDDKKRGKGKLAGGKAAKLGRGAEGTAWGDRSPTWRLPLTQRVDRIGVDLPARVHPVSPLAARIIADGSTVRAAAGSGSLFAPLTGAVLGVLAAVQTGGHAIAPTLSLMIAVVLLGVLDAFSGFVAAVTFGLLVAASGGIDSADSVRAVLGIGSIWFAAPLLAGGARAFRRPPAENAAQRWQAFGDVVLGSLLAAWAMQAAVSALPALSGLDMPVAGRADLIAGVLILALAARYAIERIAVRLYPERLAAVTFEPQGKPGTRQQVLSILFKACMFVFVILPYIGPRWQLWAVTAMTIGPSLLGLVKDRFPNSVALHRLLPRGVPNTLMMMTVGTVLGAWVAGRVDDPARLLAMSFLVLSVPGFVLSLLGLVGRDGANPAESWTGRTMGAAVALLAVLKVRGHLGDSIWLPLFLMAPAGVWWFVATRRRDEPEPEPEVEPESESADELNPALDPVLDVAAGRVEDEVWPEWPAEVDAPARVRPEAGAQTGPSR